MQTDGDNWGKWGQRVGRESERRMETTEMDCLWRLSVRLPVPSGLRLFLLDIPSWMGLPPSVWPRLGRGCHFLNWARWGKLGRFQTCRRIGLIISWMSDLQKP